MTGLLPCTATKLASTLGKGFEGVRFLSGVSERLMTWKYEAPSASIVVGEKLTNSFL
jgi:hypothetical protein